MRRPAIVLALIVLASLAARATVSPVYHGVVDEAAAQRSLAIARPFGDDLKGASDAWLSLQARSLIREGLAATGGIPLFNVQDAEPRDFFYYDHHPPGVALVTALAFGGFGESEGVARSVALAFSTITLLVGSTLAWRAAGAGAALLAAVAMVAVPAGRYWATHLDYPVPTLAMCSCFLALALPAGAGRRRRAAAAAALAAAMSFDYLALLAAAAVALERLVRGPRDARALLGWPALAAGVAGLHVVWKTLQLDRHGHGDGAGLLEHVLAVWTLPAGVGAGGFLVAVEGHLRALVTPAGEVLLVAGALRSLLPGGPADLKATFRASALLAAGAGLLPRVRASDHAYFQLYWLLPLGLAAALVAEWILSAGRAAHDASTRAPHGIAPARSGALALIGVTFLFFGFLGARADEPASDRPSAHLLGMELARALPADVAVVALPHDSSIADFVPAWYAGRVVIRLPAAGAGREGLLPWLSRLGLADSKVVLARDSRWPGRGGFEPLPKPE